MRIIGLTGGIGCGKSTVVEILASKPGFAVIDCDMLARKVVEPGTKGLAKIVETFGPEVLDGKQLDRKKLGEIVFGNEKKRKMLTDITGPAIGWEIGKLILYHFMKGTMLVVIDAPTLYETKYLLKFCAAVVVVACSPQHQMERILKRDDCTEAEAKKRISAQIPIGMKIDLADHVFWNDGDIPSCQEQVCEELIPLLEASYGMTLWHFFSFWGIVGLISFVSCAVVIIYSLKLAIFPYKFPTSRYELDKAVFD